MAHFIKSGNMFRVAPDAALDIHETLPGGVFVIKRNMEIGFFLEHIDMFSMPAKMYGSTKTQTKRVLDTFDARGSSTGVMLVGEKGSGKSLLAKMISKTAAEQGVPTIVVNQPWVGDEFNQFIQLISQPCIILLDEFEKVYDSDHQEQLLTTLDGVFSSRKLFLFTSNNKFGMDRHMQNRPGRIYYLLEFGGLTAAFIREYCEDKLSNTDYINSVVNIANAFNEFNFDMLQALVEEMNRYNEEPKDALKWLNVKAEFGGELRYVPTILINGTPIKPEQYDPDALVCRPFTQDFKVFFKKFKKVEAASVDPVDPVGEDETFEWVPIVLSPNELINIDQQTGDLLFVKDEYHVKLARWLPPQRPGVWDAF